MSWAKLDDAMGEHRKVKRALRRSRPAIALHFLGILHCSRYLTDGFVEDEYIDEVLTARERAPALAALVEHGLWEPANGGYRIHDYLDHNPTRAKVLAQRAADAARKARGRGSDSRGKPDAIQPESDRTPSGLRAESVRPVPSRPVPTTPLPPNGGSGQVTTPVDEAAPVKPTSKRKTDRQAYEASLDAWATAHFPGADPAAVGGAVGWLTGRSPGPVTADDVRQLAASSDIWRSVIEPDEPVLTDKQRDAIHAIGNRITEINDNATEAA